MRKSGLCSVFVFLAVVLVKWVLGFCLSVCPSVRVRSGEAWEQINGGIWHVWLFRVSWFVCLLAAKTMPLVEAHVSLHKCNIMKAAPEAREWLETGG